MSTDDSGPWVRWLDAQEAALAAAGDINRLRDTLRMALVSIAMEREACALTCIELTVGADCSRDWICGAQDCAIAIRARSTVLSVCRVCGGGMTRGSAILSGWSGRPDFPGQEGSEAGCTMHEGGIGRIVNCLKCPACGFSVTD